MKQKAKFKLNGGISALLCSNCSKIIKTGFQFTEEEKLASEGLKILPPQYCDKCSKNLLK